MKKKCKSILYLSIITLLILPSSYAIDMYENIDDISIILYDNAERNFFIDETRYTISGTNAMTAFLVAADQEEYTYEISDEYYNAYSSFFITSINGIENQGMDGWQYWVNYPDEEIPMVGANDYELSNGDIVFWFYGGYGVNPDTSDHVITIEISIDTDTHNPTATLIQPRLGGVYYQDNMLFNLPFLSVSLIIDSTTIIINAEDTESGIDQIKFAIDGDVKYTDFTEPYNWQYEPPSGFHRATLYITITDRSNQQYSINHSILSLG